MSETSLDRRGLSQPVTDASRWKMVLLAAIGSGIEFYDFIVYAIFAGAIARTFFNFGSSGTPLLLTFTLFAISYLVRPLAGLVISTFVDRYGRRPVFLWTLATMSACSFLMGVMPGTDTIGIAAPALFVALRLIQSACFGGEIGAAVTYVTELAPRRAGTACGILFGLLGVGAITATLVNVGLNSALPADAVASYGWRIAFVLGGLLGFVGYWIRGSLEESPAFQELKGHSAQAPLSLLGRRYLPALFVGFGICAVTGVGNGILLGYLPSTLRGTGLPGWQIATTIAIATAVQGGMVASVGWLSDRTSWIWLHRLGCLLLIAVAWPMFSLLAYGGLSPMLVLPAYAVCTAFVNACCGQLSADLFPTAVRASGITTSYNFAQAIFQGVTPLVVASLIQATADPVSPAIWLAAVAVFSGLAGLLYPRLSGHLRDAARPADAAAAGLPAGAEAR